MPAGETEFRCPGSAKQGQARETQTLIIVNTTAEDGFQRIIRSRTIAYHDPRKGLTPTVPKCYDSKSISSRRMSSLKLVIWGPSPILGPV